MRKQLYKEDDLRVQLNHVSLEYLFSLSEESLSWCEPDSEAYSFGSAGARQSPRSLSEEKFGSSSNQLNSGPSEANCWLLQGIIVGPIRA